VTPTFFGFFVVPFEPNYQKDKLADGLVIEKCNFMLKSGCIGLCLHLTKFPINIFCGETWSTILCEF